MQCVPSGRLFRCSTASACFCDLLPRSGTVATVRMPSARSSSPSHFALIMAIRRRIHSHCQLWRRHAANAIELLIFLVLYCLLPFSCRLGLQSLRRFNLVLRWVPVNQVRCNWATMAQSPIEEDALWGNAVRHSNVHGYWSEPIIRIQAVTTRGRHPNAPCLQFEYFVVRHTCL